MSEFAHVRARDFNLLTDNDTSPYPDTFERLMSAVCPEELRRCLSEHGGSFMSSLGDLWEDKQKTGTPEDGRYRFYGNEDPQEGYRSLLCIVSRNRHSLFNMGF